MKILYAGAEALPFAASGGLGDVLGALPEAVKKKLGHDSDIRVVIPMYMSVKQNFRNKLTFVAESEIWLAWRKQYLGIWSTEKNNVIYYFIDNEYYFKRQNLYGDFDDGERFAFYSKAVLEMMRLINFYPDILHANDWQSALSVIYLKRKYCFLEEYRDIKAVYTVHNILYQGIYGFDILKDVFELSDNDRNIVEYDGNINLTKGALVCADKITTVSERYSQELLSEYYSKGLHHVFKMFQYKFTGIINGIDTEYYDPKSDPEIKKNYSESNIADKKFNKKALEEFCGFEISDAPIIAIISRLVSHKGIDLIMCIFEELLIYSNIRFVILGTGEKEYEYFFSWMGEKYKDRVKIILEFNKSLSKKIYAGSDMFLMPSQTEPCGLSQMIALRYGAIPIVRETGGLFDTIKPYNKYKNTGNGFTFRNYNAHDMMHVIKEASEFYNNKKIWNELIIRAMKSDFSWNVSAEKYICIYNSL